MARAVRRAIDTVAAAGTRANGRVRARFPAWRPRIRQLRVFVHYEMYDNIPALIENWSRSETTVLIEVTVDSLVVELFRAQNFAPQQNHGSSGEVGQRARAERPASTTRAGLAPARITTVLVRRPPLRPVLRRQCMNHCLHAIDATSARWRGGVATQLTDWPRRRRYAAPRVRFFRGRALHPRGRAGSWPVWKSTSDAGDEDNIASMDVGRPTFDFHTGPGARSRRRSSSSLRVVLHDSDDSERQGLAVRETLKASAGAPRHRRDLLTG